MKRLNLVPVAILAVSLLCALVAVYVTRDTGQRSPGTHESTAVDPSAVVGAPLLDTANRMAAFAETGNEQNQARKALHLADHELDQAFATALRATAAYRAPSNGPLRDVMARIDQLKVQIAADHNRIAQLTKPGSSNADAGQLQVVQARLALDQDDFNDAQQDLARQGGDPHSAVERAFQEHQTGEHQIAQPFRSVSPSPTGTLAQQARAWLSLRALDGQLIAAQRQAASQAAILSGQHNEIEKQFKVGQTNAAAPAALPAANRVASLQQLADQRKSLAELDERIQDCQELAGIYQSWAGLVTTRQRTGLRLALYSVTKILAILLAAALAMPTIRRMFRESDHRRRLHQVGVIAAVTVQMLAAALILIVIFGVPNQISTIIGLATAGLTVALKDFIVSFFGWFALIGKNGIRVGDWVEINGVSGEVIEIGLLKTVLLELGNWTDTGHPTGRQVAFSNSFAMEGHYFNFSTAGQWLWDELEVTLPAASDPYLLASEIRKLVERETAADSIQAAQDWEHVTSHYGARSFSSKPAVNLRPSINGLEVVMRYITRAPQRNVVKSRLFQLIVDLLHKSAVEKAAKV